MRIWNSLSWLALVVVAASARPALADGETYTTACQPGAQSFCEAHTDRFVSRRECTHADGWGGFNATCVRGGQPNAVDDPDMQPIRACMATGFDRRTRECRVAALSHAGINYLGLGFQVEVIRAQNIEIGPGGRVKPPSDPPPPPPPPAPTMSDADRRAMQAAEAAASGQRRDYCSRYPTTDKRYTQCLRYDCTQDPQARNTTWCQRYAQANGIWAPPTGPAAAPAFATTPAQANTQGNASYVEARARVQRAMHYDDALPAGVPRDPTHPLVNTTLYDFMADWDVPIGTEFNCPPWAADYNCFPDGGAWATDPANGQSVSLANASSTETRRLFRALQPVMLEDLGDFQLNEIGERVIASVVAAYPRDPAAARAKIEEYFGAASCLSNDRKNALRNSANRVLALRDVPANLERHRMERLGPDLVRTSHVVAESKAVMDQIKPQFEPDGRCGWAMHLNNLVGECTRLFHALNAATATYERAFQAYPFLAIERGFRYTSAANGITRTEASRQPMWRTLLDSGGDARAMARTAVRIHDDMISEQLDAGIRQARAACSGDTTDFYRMMGEDPEKLKKVVEDDRLGLDLTAKQLAGYAAMANPRTALAYLSQNPGSGWVFCGSFAMASRDKAFKNFLKQAGQMVFMAASIVATGGTASVLFAAADIGLTILDHQTQQHEARLERDHFLAGIGDVGRYLEAENTIRGFYRNLGRDLAMSGLGLVPDAVSVVRAWREASRITDTASTAFHQLDSEMVTWYRSRATELYGPRAGSLSDDSIRTLARMEDEGRGSNEILAFIDQADGGAAGARHIDDSVDALGATAPGRPGSSGSSATVPAHGGARPPAPGAPSVSVSGATAPANGGARPARPGSGGAPPRTPAPRAPSAPIPVPVDATAPMRGIPSTFDPSVPHTTYTRPGGTNSIAAAAPPNASHIPLDPIPLQFDAVTYRPPGVGRSATDVLEDAGIHLPANAQPLGQGGFRVAYEMPGNPNQVVKVYQPQRIPVADKYVEHYMRLHPGADRMTVITELQRQFTATMVQREMALHRYLRRIEAAYDAAGKRPPFRVAEIVSTPEQLERGIIIQRRVRGEPIRTPTERDPDISGIIEPDEVRIFRDELDRHADAVDRVISPSLDGMELYVPSGGRHGGYEQVVFDFGGSYSNVVNAPDPRWGDIPTLYDW